MMGDGHGRVAVFAAQASNHAACAAAAAIPIDACALIFGLGPSACCKLFIP